jgi:hypothetical protein
MGVRFVAGKQIFSLLRSIRISSGTYPEFFPVDNRQYFEVVKRLGRQIDLGGQKEMLLYLFYVYILIDT